MAITAVSICNSALIKIGTETIGSLSDSNKRAILCNEQYSKLRDEVLEAHPWTFAKTRASLAADATAPAWGWTVRYAMPADCLGILGLDYSDIEYAIEGRYILTDEAAPLNILYTKQVTDTSVFTPTFAEALACRIAADLAYPIAQSNTLQATMLDAYSKILREARTTNSQRGGTPPQIEADSWINSRN